MTEQHAAATHPHEEWSTHRLVPSVGACFPPVPPFGNQRLRLTLGGVFPSVGPEPVTATIYAYAAPPVSGHAPELRGVTVGDRRRIGPWDLLVAAITLDPVSVEVHVLSPMGKSP